MIIKARIVNLIKDNELNIKLGSVRYMFASAREQLVKKNTPGIRMDHASMHTKMHRSSRSQVGIHTRMKLIEKTN